jgi:hypothetical protein
MPDIRDETWFNSTWRPAMAWQYMAVCIFDFILAPILTGLYSAYMHEYHAWEPLSTGHGGLYHVAMGAVLGITVWSRGQEKMMVLNSSNGLEEPK